jgi:phosphoribosylglycinamide formyltransferase 1
MINIAILISGRGSNMEAILRSCRENRIDGQVTAVISNKANAKGLETAASFGVQTIVLQEQNELINKLKELAPDLICLAGFMKILNKEFVQTFNGKIINIHPSLLPAFPGLDVQQKALDYGVKQSGCTVHFVDEGCDTGPIIKQAAVPILEDDDAGSLAQRILKEEHRIYSEAIQLFALNKLTIEGRIVHVQN